MNNKKNVYFSNPKQYSETVSKTRRMTHLVIKLCWSIEIAVHFSGQRYLDLHCARSRKYSAVRSALTMYSCVEQSDVTW